MKTDEHLIAGLKDNQDWAKECFWSRYEREIQLICARVLGPGPDAVDTAVDVLIEFMFDAVHRLSHPKALRSYLRLMAVRRCYRRQQEQCKYRDTNTDLLNDDSGRDPETETEFRRMMEGLNHCLGTLTPKAQQIMRLRYGRQITNEQIGGLVGGSKQYIGRVIRKSLGLLKVCLDQRTQGQASMI